MRDVLKALPVAGVALIVFLLFLVVAWLVKKAVHRYAAATGRRNLALAIGRLAYGLIIVVGLLVAAVIVFPNFTPTKLLASLGIGGVVLGLAFKDVLQNYLAGCCSWSQSRFVSTTRSASKTMKARFRIFRRGLPLSVPTTVGGWSFPTRSCSPTA